MSSLHTIKGDASIDLHGASTSLVADTPEKKYGNSACTHDFSWQTSFPASYHVVWSRMHVCISV